MLCSTLSSSSSSPSPAQLISLCTDFLIRVAYASYLLNFDRIISLRFIFLLNYDEALTTPSCSNPPPSRSPQSTIRSDHVLHHDNHTRDIEHANISETDPYKSYSDLENSWVFLATKLPNQQSPYRGAQRAGTWILSCYNPFHRCYHGPASRVPATYIFAQRGGCESLGSRGTSPNPPCSLRNLKTTEQPTERSTIYDRPYISTFQSEDTIE